MGAIWRTFLSSVPLVVIAAAAAADEGAAPAAAPVAPQPAATSAPAPKGDLHDEIERLVGTSVHGTLTARYQLRTTEDATDQDFEQFLNLHVGDENRDRVSGTLFVRAYEDLDSAHEGEPGFVFGSLDDTFGNGINALLYSAYVTIRPEGGPFESLRLGRQYVYAAETFHVDGASATTRPLVDSIGLTLTAYGGIPVHFYESSSSGDWLLGLRLAADPWKGGRVALDYTHDEDRLSMIGTEPENDFAAISVWQQVTKELDLYGQYTWIDGPRDFTVRATASFPEIDLTVQAAYYHLLEDQRELATEFDPYTTVIQELVGYHQADLRVSKGFGENFDVEIGGASRQLLPGETETRFNRDTCRVYVTPTLSDLPWMGTSVSVTGERYEGAGETLETWGLDVSHRFSKGLRMSVGSDYALYGFGPLASEERTHVRTAYARAKFPLTDSLSADVRYTWERDDEETFHVLTLALVLDF